MLPEYLVKGGSREYYTNKDIVWRVGKKDGELFLYIPKGTEFESSIPTWLRWLITTDHPQLLKAALIHDVLLDRGYRPVLAAIEWYDAALSDGFPRVKAILATIFIWLYTETVYPKK